jgi:selenocysteine lyase/cysteine desulfurase
MPIAVQEAEQRELRSCTATFEDGYGSFVDERRIAAPSFGCSPDELAFTSSTSDSMFRALFGLTWQAGDELNITDQEHAGTATPERVIAQKYG